MRLRVAALALVLIAAATLALLDGGQAPAYAAPDPPPVLLPVRGSHPLEHLHRFLDGSNRWGAATSTNWAGYAAAGTTFTSVTASWIEPAVQPGYSTAVYAAFWVGLDGAVYGSNTVEQTGTAAESVNGSVDYYAWYEMYPDAPVTIDAITITPGDRMTGTVTSDGAGDFTLTLLDNTTGASFTTSQSDGVSAPSSVEVIAEAPATSSGAILTLADFGSVGFSACTFNGALLSTFPSNRLYQIDMLSGGVTVAATSALGGDGASFSVASYPGDSTPPTTTVVGADGLWHNQPVTLALSAIDGAGGSGTRSITYQLDSGAPVTVVADATQVTIFAPSDHSNDGVHTVSFHSTDNNGNQEPARSATVKIDTTPPKVSASGPGNRAWLKHAATIVLSAADNSGGSGLASIVYTRDGVAHTVAGASARVVLPTLPNANHTLSYRATDLAGNTSAGGRLGVHIDTTGPSTAARPAGGYERKAIKLAYRVSDNLSPRATSVTLTIRNGRNRAIRTFKLGAVTTSVWHTVNWTPAARGSYSYTIHASDLAGNSQTKASSAVIAVN